MSLRTSGVTRRSALVAGGAGLTSLAGCLDAIRDLNPLAGDDWSQYRGDRRSGGRTDSGPGIDFDDDWRWEVDPPDDAEFVKTVLSATVGTDGSVFLTGSLQYGSGDDTTREGFVVALDAESGDERWGETLDGAVTAAPKAADGDLYVPTTTPPLTCVSADDGSENWTYDPGDDVPSPNFPPAVGDERIHLSTGTSLRAVARDDGDEEWVEPIGQEVEPSPGRVYPPVLHDGTLYATADQYQQRGPGYLAALDPDDGDEQWRFEPERGDREVTGVFGCPVPMDGSVYVSGYRYLVSADGEGRPEDIEFLVCSLDGDDGDPEDEDDDLASVSFHPVEGGETLYLQGWEWVGATDPSDLDVETESLERLDALAPPALVAGRLVVPQLHRGQSDPARVVAFEGA
jgi:outer membrane protein assembly factor BamB